MLSASAHSSSTQSASALPPQLTAEAPDRFVKLALSCVHQEYPNQIAHVMSNDSDARPPRALTPAFYGCFDWHSAVHGHWLLVRSARMFPDAAFAPAVRAALAKSLTTDNIATEVAYLRTPGRASFERPYGLAWVLQLSAELRSWDDADAKAWANALAPLETEAAARISDWLPKLHYPIRVGEHSQTAFAFGLIWDWAQVTHNARMTELLSSRARTYYEKDRACPLHYEPSGHDFLSPCLAEADLMRRVLPPAEFSKWLRAFLPNIPHTAKAVWLEPGVVTDRKDPKLAHIDGLNLSRAWMLEGIARGLPKGDRRLAALHATAAQHADAALPAVTGEHYEGGHWLGTFALYLVSQGMAKSM